MSVVKPNPVQIEAAKDLLYVPGRTELALSVQREAIRDVARMTRMYFDCNSKTTLFVNTCSTSSTPSRFWCIILISYWIIELHICSCILGLINKSLHVILICLWFVWQYNSKIYVYPAVGIWRVPKAPVTPIQVLPRYGFDGSEYGVAQMLEAWGPPQSMLFATSSFATLASWHTMCHHALPSGNLT